MVLEIDECCAERMVNWDDGRSRVKGWGKTIEKEEDTARDREEDSSCEKVGIGDLRLLRFD